MAVVWIAALWIAFAATHMGMSSLRWRPRLVAALGDRGFQAVYSLLFGKTSGPRLGTFLAAVPRERYLHLLDFQE